MQTTASVSRLTTCFDGSQNGQGSNVLSIIIVPEIGTHPSARTIKTLVQIQPTSRIFEVQYSLSTEEHATWAPIIQKAGDLFDLMLEQPQLWGHPFVMICHGFGGIIAKRTLGLLDDRYWDIKVKQLFNAQSGIVFIWTPHLTHMRQDLWPRLALILRVCPTSRKWQNPNDILTIVNVCAKFEEANIDEPILSVYESRETRISEGRFRSQKLILVDRALAEIGAMNEVVAEVEADHLDAECLDLDSEYCRHFITFFNKVHQNRPRLLSTATYGFQTLNIEGHDNNTWTSTVSHVADEDSGRLFDNDSRNISTLVTLGTTQRSVSQSEAVVAADFQEFRPSLQLPCHFLSMYTKNPDFYGRENELSQMDYVLIPGSSSQRSIRPRAFAIYGLGGVGKTQCALEYAISRKSKFDAVLWAQADTTAKLDESFSQISVALGLETVKKAGDRVVSRNLVIEWLSNPIKGPEASVSEPGPEEGLASWLLIFDNANDPTLLADFWPSSGTGAIIVTSRDPLSKRYFSCEGMDLKPLETVDAAALLRNLTDTKETPEDVDASTEVAKRMGGLPLAITLAAAAILRQELRFQEFLGLYEAEPQAADIRPISLRPDNEYQHTLSTVWKLDTLSRQAECLLRLLSVMDPDAIDETILTQAATTPLPVEYPDNQTAFVDARTSLLKFSLVKRNKTLSQLNVHRLTQDFVRAKMSAVELEAFFSAALSFCMQYWPIPVVPASYSVKNWPASQAVVPHLLFLRSLWIRRPELAHSPAVKQNLAELSWRVGWYFTERGIAGEDVQGLLRTSHEICEADPPLRMSETHAGALFALAATNNFENDPVAGLKYGQKNLQINLHLKRDPKIDPHMGLAYNQYGWGLMMNDRWEDAARAFRDSIKVYDEWEETKKGYRPEFPWGGLALALSEMGQHEEAAAIFLETMRHRTKMYGPDDTESIKLGWAAQGLGYVRLKQGRLDESLKWYQKALANYTAISGPRYFRTGQVLTSLGEHYALQLDFDAAETYYTQALRVFQDRDAYKGECARITHKQAQMYESKAGSESMAAMLRERASSLYAEVINSGKLSVYGATLENEDFDKVVNIWAR